MPPESEEKSPLGRLRDRLYAPKPAATFPVAGVGGAAPPPQTGWAPPPTPAPHAPKKPGIPRTLLFLLIAGGFFLVALTAAGLLIFFGGRTVSTDNVLIAVQGSNTIASGDTITLLVRVTNQNPVPISATTLSVDFPDGTRTAEDVTAPYTHYSDTLGEIPAGGTAERTIRAVVFGSEGQHVTLPMRFEYRTPGSSNAFVKESTYDFTITTSPLSLSVGSLSQVSANQPFTLSIAVRSNATAPLNSVAVQAAYPPGFLARETTPAPVAGSLFPLGTLAPGEEKVVKITGTLSGEDKDARVFRFTAGTQGSASATTIAVPYTSANTTVTLEKPFLATTLSLDGDTSGNTVITQGASVEGMLSWVNTLTAPVQDAQVSVRFGGTAFDPDSIRAGSGFYRSSDTTLVFSKETIPTLARLAPGANGSGAFIFATKSGEAGKALRNPTVDLTISVAGRRVNERNVPENVNSTVTRTLKVATDLTLAASATHKDGSIANTGPVPPKADTETTYTITWTIANTVNSVGGTKVTATLPSYVRFTNSLNPSDSAISYNATTRVVTWNAGDVPAGGTKTVSFQVALLPSASQRGTSPVLVTSQEVAGVDRFTSTKVGGTTNELTTRNVDGSSGEIQ